MSSQSHLEGVRIGEAARTLGLSPATLRRYDRAGVLPAQRDPVSGYRVYSRTQLDSFSSERSGRSDVVSLAERAVAVLRSRYGSPDLGNPSDPLDVLFYTLLSLRTTDKVLQRVWPVFVERFRPWGRLLEAEEADVASVVGEAGFGPGRARRFKDVVACLSAWYGEVTLGPLAFASDDEALEALTRLPGVGEKTARCVMLFGLRRDLCPVDAHVHRVATRLGLIDAPADSVAAHAAVDAVTPPAAGYHLHVNFVAHGRAVCRARRPRCDECDLAGLCPSTRGACV